MPTKPEIEALINDLLAANDSPGYGITVRNIASDPPTIDVEFRFLSGRTYCCAEPGCHLPRDLSRLPLLAGFTIRWHCIVEQGAQLKCLAALGLPLNSPGYEYEFATGGSN
jgi:hypothetical protein